MQQTLAAGRTTNCAWWYVYTYFVLARLANYECLSPERQESFGCGCFHGKDIVVAFVACFEIYCFFLFEINKILNTVLPYYMSMPCHRNMLLVCMIDDSKV